MQSSPIASAAVLEHRCAKHPEVPSVATCSRCGDYHCAHCHKRIAGRALCANCRALPGVDYLEDTRQRFWGKRDSYTWYFGLFMPFVSLCSLPALIRAGEVWHVVSNLVWLVALLAYFAQVRAMRLGLIAGTTLDAIVNFTRLALGWAVIPSVKPLTAGTAMLLGVLLNCVGLLIVIAAYRSPRNKLAFKIPVDDAALQRVYDRYVSNPPAIRAAVYSVLCVFIPFASALTLLMGVSALRRANAEAWPPRGGRLPAKIGIAISSLGLLGWTSQVLWVSHKWHWLGL